MKELSIEQKAQRYDEALEKLRSLHDDYDTVSTLIDIKEELENIFPELKESEDEKIRKELYESIRINNSREVADKYIAWLEKQSEQKQNFCHHEVDLSECSEEYRKAYYDGWNNCNMQHSQCRSELDDVVKCLINGMKFYYEDNEEATWGTDKWSMPVRHIIEVLEKQGEKKPTIEMITPEESLGIDSDTYNKIVDECIYGDKVEPQFKVGDTIKCKYDDRQFTIKSVNLDKGTYTYTQEGCGNDIDYADEEFELVEHKPAWSEEDETKIKSIIAFLKSPTLCAMDGNKGIIDENIKYLKSLKDRVQPQPKREWSEDDDSCIRYLIECLEVCAKGTSLKMVTSTAQKYVEWLKSIKGKYTWKPSDEQMADLWNMVCECRPADQQLLQDLYFGLKTLKGE